MGWDGHKKKRTRANDGIAKQPDRQRGTDTIPRWPHTQTASKKIDLVEEESEVKSGERSVALNKCLQSRIRAQLNDSVVAFLFLRFASCEEGS